MELSASQSNSYGFAQTGYIEFNDGTSNEYLFAEWAEVSGGCAYRIGPGACMRTWGTTCCGSNNQFDVIYDYVRTGHIQMDINGSVVGETSYIPSSSNGWPGPWTSQFSGETHDAGDDVPGSSSTKATFSSVGYYPTLGGGVSSLPSYTRVSDEPYYCNQAVDYQTFNIWTSGSC